MLSITICICGLYGIIYIEYLVVYSRKQEVRPRLILRVGEVLLFDGFVQILEWCTIKNNLPILWIIG